MQNLIVACVQPRMAIQATSDEFVAEARRFLRQAQAKAAQITIFPELTGVMLAPPLISNFKLGMVKRDDRGKQPGSGFLARSLGRFAGAGAGALGGGFRGSLGRLLQKRGDVLLDLYIETFAALASEYSTAIVGGSLYIWDPETETIRNRAYVFDVDGEVVGYQDKLNLASDEQELASPGTELNLLQTRYGQLGLLIGRDALYPELSRLLAMQGADLIAGVVASPGAAQASVTRSALALRAEENQVYTAASFLLGPNHLGRKNREDYFGQSALLAPISLTSGGGGVLIQTGTNRTEGIVAAELDGEALETLRETSGFRPRAEMHLGSMGPILGEMYDRGLSIEQAIEQRLASPPEPAAFVFEPVAEPFPASSEFEPLTSSVPEAMILGEDPEAEAEVEPDAVEEE